MLTITYNEFLNSSLLGAKLVDHQHPRMRCEENLFRIFEFADGFVRYVDAQDRNRRNDGSMCFELLIVSDTPRGYSDEARVQ